ncbi:MAG: glycosyltransferase family 9 protein [Candidatus Eremiobacteraeota bacterium]|nr:glycosyltransferase family 9 protein [Candidatus Eremiobacteraeota bacterium]MBV8583828.1 glycosyltransferase family 9 protein [Candidatus Eremiobacteraeota bacterium]
MSGGSPSVLVIRLDAIGDALALTPMLAALRERAIPADVLLGPANAGVFSAGAVRRAIVARTIRQRSADRSNLAAVAALGEELRGAAYSHVLVATEDPAGYRLARATGAPVRAGFTNLWGKPGKTLWSWRYVNVRVFRSAGLDSSAPHECEVLFRLARPILGDAAVPTRDPSLLRPLVIDGEPARDERVAIQVTDKWERLGMSTAAVAELVERVGAAYAVHLVAASHESSYADRFAGLTGRVVERFAELAPWKDAIAGARAIVAPDSGALHVAGMVGTPVVGVFPPSRAYELQAARWSPWAAPYRIVRGDDEWPRAAAAALAGLT